MGNMHLHQAIGADFAERATKMTRRLQILQLTRNELALLNALVVFLSGLSPKLIQTGLSLLEVNREPRKLEIQLNRCCWSSLSSLVKDGMSVNCPIIDPKGLPEAQNCNYCR